MTQTLLEQETAQGMFIIENDRGLHTRPSTEIVKWAAQFKSDIRLRYQKTEVNAKSILGILMLAAPRGARISIIATGEDAQEAVDTLVNLSRVKFNIKY